MQRKPGYPSASCNIKMPDNMSVAVVDSSNHEDDASERRRQQLINFGHVQWGFNNWSWSVTKQDLDFVEYVGGRHTAGVACFVAVHVKTLDVRRENVGYATATAPLKGSAIHQARKGSVTNALRETLLGFGGAVATELNEMLNAAAPAPPAPAAPAAPAPAPDLQENNQNLANKPDLKSLPKNVRKEEMRAPPPVKNAGHAPLPRPPAPHPAPHPPAHPAHPPAHPAPHPPAHPPHPAAHPAPRNNDVPKPLEEMSGQEARAERRRRQRLAQEEFRLKRLGKDPLVVSPEDDADSLLLGIRTPDEARRDKRQSPDPPGGGGKRRNM